MANLGTINRWGAKVLLVFSVCLCSCSPKIVERIVVQHDTTRVVVRDSVRFYDRDSIYIREKGDTVYQYVEKWRYRDRFRVDTFYRVKVDSVAVERIKEVRVEKPLGWWQNWRIKAFWWLIILCIVGFRREIIAIIKKII